MSIIVAFRILVLISEPLTTEVAADGRPHCGFPLRPFVHHQDTTSYVRDPFHSWWKSYIYYNLTAFTWIYRGIGSHPDELCHFSILTGPTNFGSAATRDISKRTKTKCTDNRAVSVPFTTFIIDEYRQGNMY